MLLDGESHRPGGSLDLRNDIRFSVDGQAAADWTHVDSARLLEGARRIGPGEQLDVGLRLLAPQAGQYSLALRFAGANTSGDGPKVAITLNVKHHWAWGVLAVLLALIVSFLVSKGIVNWRARLRMRGNIHRLQRESFTDAAELPSEIFLRAVLEQVGELIGRLWFLPPPVSAREFMARAELVAMILRKHDEVRARLRSTPVGDLVQRHFDEAIEQAMHAVGITPLDQPTTERVIANLTQISLNLAEAEIVYGASIVAKAEQLVRQANELPLDPVPDSIARLLTALRTPDPKSKVFEEAYWLVRLFHAQRAFPHFGALVACFERTQRRDQTFQCADELMFEYLKEQLQPEAALKINSTPLPHQLESLHPIKFLLEFEDKALEKSFFVRHQLVYDWSFELTSQRAGVPPDSWARRSKKPRATQYMKVPGEVEVTASIRWGDKPLARRQGKVLVGPNTELAVLRNLDVSELVLMGLILVITLVTALPALYFAKETFGVFEDYVAILAWAIGIDQSKNLIQMFSAYPADPAAP